VFLGDLLDPGRNGEPDRLELGRGAVGRRRRGRDLHRRRGASRRDQGRCASAVRDRSRRPDARNCSAPSPPSDVRRCRTAPASCTGPPSGPRHPGANRARGVGDARTAASATRSRSRATTARPLRTSGRLKPAVARGPASASSESGRGWPSKRPSVLAAGRGAVAAPHGVCVCANGGRGAPVMCFTDGYANPATRWRGPRSRRSADLAPPDGFVCRHTADPVLPRVSAGIRASSATGAFRTPQHRTPLVPATEPRARGGALRRAVRRAGVFSSRRRARHPHHAAAASGPRFPVAPCVRPAGVSFGDPSTAGHRLGLTSSRCVHDRRVPYRGPA